jgi:beta-lactamase regulating signal transducer with metallopeptidase domain
MNSFLFFTPSPVLAILFKWTSLLALGWTAHWLLRDYHARWRLILWRSILCFGLILPLAHVFQIPVLKIPIYGLPALTTGLPDALPPVVTGNPIQPGQSVAQSPEKPVEASTNPRSVSSPRSQTSREPGSWKGFLLIIWVLGFVWGAFRLVRLQVQLSRLRKEASLASAALQKLAREVQARFGVQRTIRIQVSDSVTSPFVCGLLKPTILLPGTLAQTLSPDEVSALLSHETAHLCQHDLVWCVGWRWMKAICWFHPLVWKVPAAHNLTCEQEADRIASGQLEERGFYTQLLARLALRVLALPAVETRLTVNGTSQIARRLNHLRQERIGAWKWGHSVVAFGLAGGLLLVTAGWEFSKINAADAKHLPARAFKEVLVVVEDEDGEPIEGATIQPDGLRVRGQDRASHYGWDPKLYGPASEATTDREGKARVKYPVEAFPEEELLTGEISFSVVHPDFSPTRPTEFSVDGNAKPIRLIRGIHLEVAGYFGSARQPVLELVPNVSEGPRPEDWQKKENGIFAFHQLSPGGHLLQLMGRLPSGEIVFSEGLAFNAERGKPSNFALEMKPGIRLEGRVDEKVPRPVKNGRVLICVRPKEFPAWLVPEDMAGVWEKLGHFRFWSSYRPIAEDGSFVFESIPPGEVDVIVHGDGFVSQNGGQPENRMNSQLMPGLVIGVPQPFPLLPPLTRIDVVTEPTATLELTAKTKWGKPVAGATVYLNPNVMRMPAGIFGWARDSSEEAFRPLAPLPALPYSGITDQNGMVVLRNIPAITRGLNIEHPQFEAALQEGWGDRYIRFKLLPGIPAKLELTLQPKGNR